MILQYLGKLPGIPKVRDHTTAGLQVLLLLYRDAYQYEYRKERQRQNGVFPSNPSTMYLLLVIVHWQWSSLRGSWVHFAHYLVRPYSRYIISVLLITWTSFRLPAASQSTAVLTPRRCHSFVAILLYTRCTLYYTCKNLCCSTCHSAVRWVSTDTGCVVAWVLSTRRHPASTSSTPSVRAGSTS